MEVMDGMGFLDGGVEVRGERQGRFGLDLSAEEEGRLTRSVWIGVVIAILCE